MNAPQYIEFSKPYLDQSDIERAEILRIICKHNNRMEFFVLSELVIRNPTIELVTDYYEGFQVVFADYAESVHFGKLKGRSCTGCGWEESMPLPPGSLACCPDSRYR